MFYNSTSDNDRYWKENNPRFRNKVLYNNDLSYE